MGAQRHFHAVLVATGCIVGQPYAAEGIGSAALASAAGILAVAFVPLGTVFVVLVAARIVQIVQRFGPETSRVMMNVAR